MGNFLSWLFTAKGTPSKFESAKFDSDACMTRRIKHHHEHLGEHPGGHEQAVAIAAHECGISRNSAEDYSKLGCYQSQVARFEAAPKSIQINGGKYEAVDTGDGYHTVKDVPIFSEIPKGTHGAPYDVTKERLEKFLGTMQSRYTQGNRTGALSVGHNDDLGLTHPDFAGFFLPHRVGPYKFPDGKERWTLFADFKLPNDKFEMFEAGKLHSHSPEIYPKGWDEHIIDIVSFLDTKPPYFDFAFNTVGTVTKNASAKFEAIWEKDMTLDELKKKIMEEDISKLFGEKDAKAIAAKFAKYDGGGDGGDGGDGGSSAAGGDGGGDGIGEGDGFDDGFAKLYPKTHSSMKKHFDAMAKIQGHLGLAKMDGFSKKPDALPVEPGQTSGGSKMELDPKVAAKFAVQETKIAELDAKLAAKENEEKAKVFVSKADSALSRKVVPESMKTHISQFAAQAASTKDGEKKFLEFVDILKASLRDKPPSNMAEFQAASLPSVEPTDPIFSKFVNESPADREHIAKFSQDWRITKERLGDNYSCTEEAYIKNNLDLLKANRNGNLSFENRR